MYRVARNPAAGAWGEEEEEEQEEKEEERSRARRDGAAAADAAAAKRRRYWLAGPSLVPLPFEAGGRPGEDTIGFVRRCGAAWAAQHGEDGVEKKLVTGQLWQQVSTLLQLGNAEMILSANGR